MDIKKDNKNELMNRREIQAVVTSDKTPSFAEVSKMVGDKFKADDDQIMVEKVGGKFGKGTFLIEADIYDTKELKDESVKRLIKPKKGAAAPAEQE